MGVVKGSIEVAENGLTLQNGLQIAGSGVGLGANAIPLTRLKDAAKAAKAKGVVARIGKLLGHNEYAVGDAAKAARTKQSLLDYYKKHAKTPSIRPVEGMAGTQINTVTGEIRTGQEILDNYPHLADSYLVEELRHFKDQQKMLGRTMTAAEEAALEKDIVEFMARPESGFKVFDPSER